MHWFWVWLALFLVVTYGFMESYRSYAPIVARPLSYIEPQVVPGSLQVKPEPARVEVPVTQWTKVIKDMSSETQDDLKKVRPLGFLKLMDDTMNSDVLMEIPSQTWTEQYQEAPADLDVFEGYSRPAKKAKKSPWTVQASQNNGSEDIRSRAIVDVHASEQTSLLMRHYGSEMLQGRQNPVVTRQRETLDDIEDLAARQGLSVDQFLAIRNQSGSQNEKDRELKARKAEMFRNEVSNEVLHGSNRPLTNNLAEIAGLVRDSLQHVPTQNEELAYIVMQDILRARKEARELQVNIPKASEEHIQTLRNYQRSLNAEVASLATQILARI